MTGLSPQASPWTRAGLARAAVIAAVSLGTGAVLGYAVAHEPRPEPLRPADPPPAPSASASPRPEEPAPEALLLSPLHQGSVLEGYDLAEIHPIREDGVLRLACRKARSTVHLQVALSGPGDPPRSLITGPYVVIHAVENADPAEGERLAKALVAVLEANAAVPPPRRLKPYAARR